MFNKLFFNCFVQFSPLYFINITNKIQLNVCIDTILDTNFIHILFFIIFIKMFLLSTKYIVYIVIILQFFVNDFLAILE